MKHRGEKRMWAVGINEAAAGERQAPPPRREFRKVITLWIPRHFLSDSGVDVRGFISDVNDKVQQRGFVLWDGHVLTTAITDVTVGEGPIRPTSAEGDAPFLQRLIRVGERTEVVCEPESREPFEVPPARAWGPSQQAFFQLTMPYQMAEDASAYSYHHLTTVIAEPYLLPQEMIAAIVHGVEDRYFFYCPCHCAEVVYTTRARLVCMSCGATHAVLRDPLAFKPDQLLSAEEWHEFFDVGGSRLDEEVRLSTVDFRDLENAATIWTTNQWSEAKHRFVFFARSSPEEVAEAIRGTEADASILLEAGFTPIETAPPPAHQVAEDSLDLDLVENAAHALCDGVASYLGARTNSERLANAIPQLFRAAELLLKARLQELDPNALVDHPNNPTVLKRLLSNGVVIPKSDVDALHRLRKLRNKLQHGTAAFNHRTGLASARSAVILLDWFSRRELGLWIADVLPSDSWYALLQIDQIASGARGVAAARLEDFREDPAATIEQCLRCGEETMLRPHRRAGASCVTCGYVPVAEFDRAEYDAPDETTTD